MTLSGLWQGGSSGEGNEKGKAGDKRRQLKGGTACVAVAVSRHCSQRLQHSTVEFLEDLKRVGLLDPPSMAVILQSLMGWPITC